MRRREFIAGLGGAVAAWPVVGRAQQGERLRRIGVLLPAGPDNPQFQKWVKTLLQGLAQLGWIDGRNVKMDIHWASNAADIQKHAGELATLAPDVIVAHGSVTVGPMLRASRTIPIVFPVSSDPVAAGFVDSLAHPGGTVTGFLLFEYSLSAKWLELLKHIAPNVTRAAVFRDPAIPAGIGQFAAIQSVAPSLGMEVTPVNMRDVSEMGRTIGVFASLPNGGVIVTSSALSQIHANLIISLAARYNLPAVYYERFYVADGGLASYGADYVDQYRRAALYVDRVLKGEKPADLPVQAPTKYELAINLKTAKTLGLNVAPSLLARADEVIE